MSGSAYLLRRVAEDLAAEADRLRAHPAYRTLGPGAAGIIEGLTIAAMMVEAQWRATRHADRKHETRP